MKEKIILTTKEQVDLIADPMGLSIINNLGEKVKSKDEIFAELNEERPKLIEEYLVELCKQGIVEEAAQDGKTGYKLVAYSIHTDRKLISSAPEYWVSGMLNHIENELNSVVKELASRGQEDYLKDLGYEDLIMSNSNISLTVEDIKEIKDFIARLAEKSREQEDKEGTKKYSLNILLYPSVTEFKKRVNEANEPKEK